MHVDFRRARRVFRIFRKNDFTTKNPHRKVATTKLYQTVSRGVRATGWVVAQSLLSCSGAEPIAARSPCASGRFLTVLSLRLSAPCGT